MRQQNLLFVAVAILLGVFIGCRPSSKAQLEENKAMYRRLIQELDNGNFEIIDELCAPEFISHFPGSPKPRNREEHKQVIRSFYTAFPDLRHTIEDLIAEDDRVVIRVTDRGTHEGEFLGIAPTGKEVAFSAIGVARVADGKFVETWVDLDWASIFQQIGTVPPTWVGQYSFTE